MKSEYFDHHILLIDALTLVTSCLIFPEDLETDNKSLILYVKNFRKLYMEMHMTCNLHQLLHLVETVERFGPLWTTCFGFENLNGILKSLVNSPKKEMQICSSVNKFMRYILLKNDNDINHNQKVMEYCEQTVNRITIRRSVKLIRNNMKVIGKITKPNFDI